MLVWFVFVLVCVCGIVVVILLDGCGGDVIDGLFSGWMYGYFVVVSEYVVGCLLLLYLVLDGWSLVVLIVDCFSWCGWKLCCYCLERLCFWWWLVVRCCWDWLYVIVWFVWVVVLVWLRYLVGLCYVVVYWLVWCYW